MNAEITDFADYTDLVAFIRKASTFLSQEQIQQCLRVGDNGIGASGTVTATDVTPMVALSSDEIISRWGSLPEGWGKQVMVTVDGVTKPGEVQDISPSGVCDLNPAMLKSLGQKHPFSTPGTWVWLDDEQQQHVDS